MAVLCPADQAQVVTWTHENIPEDALADDGYENSPHVTALYGFEPGVTEAEIRGVARQFGRSAIMQLREVGRFDSNPAYDVLHVKVKSPDLCELNALLVKKFKVKQTFDFHPHLSLAYVKKGAAAKLDGHCYFQDSLYVLDELVFSAPESVRKYSVSLVADQK